MAKYLVSACYTAEGLKGLAKDKAAKRKQAIEQALATVGGKLDAIYWRLERMTRTSSATVPTTSASRHSRSRHLRAAWFAQGPCRF